MPRNYYWILTSRKYHDYTYKTLQNCLSQVKANKISMKIYSIPYGTIRNKINGWHNKKHEGHKQLPRPFEKNLVGTIDQLTEWKVPLSGYDIRWLVKTYLDKIDYLDPRFNDNLPVLKWNFSDFKMLNNNLILTSQTDFVLIM